MAAHQCLKGRERRLLSSPPLGGLAKRTLLAAYAPASVLINAKREGLHFFGPTDHYLKIASGDASQDILVMAREGLRGKLRTAIDRARSQARTLITGARLDREGGPVMVNIAVLPVHGEGEGLLLVSFTDEAKREPRPIGQGESPADGSRVAELEQELELNT